MPLETTDPPGGTEPAVPVPPRGPPGPPAAGPIAGAGAGADEGPPACPGRGSQRLLFQGSGPDPGRRGNGPDRADAPRRELQIAARQLLALVRRSRPAAGS